MNEVRTLFEKFWICKDTEKETYYKVKRDIPAFQRFVREQLGWRLVHTENILKLEKRPAHAEPFMGISEFTEIRDYCILCVVLMYLEDKEEQEQFLLSELIDYVETQLKDYMEVDWTSFSQRKSLVRVLQYMEKLQMLRVYEGKSESFGAEAGQEVLYENTGASKWFVRNFPKDIISYASPEDFRESEWFEVDEDRGFARRHRVYKRLLFAPAMYREDGSGEDFEYLKNYRGRLIDELEQLFECHVHIHRGSAYFLAGDECKIGTVFPGNNSLADILLLCFGEIRRKIESGEWKTTPEEMCIVDKITFETLIKEVKHTYGSGFAKMYRDMPEGEFVENVTEEMERWMFLKKEDDMHQIKICPLTGKIQGSYPQDYMGGTEDEQQMAGE